MKAETNQTHRPEGMAFYSQYVWCLNPILKIKDVVCRLEQELDRRVTLQTSWQRAESVVNIYLLLCAATCGADDYLTNRPWNFRWLARRLPTFSRFIIATEWCLNYFPRLISMRDRNCVYQWRQHIGRGVDAICELLAAAGSPDEESESFVLITRQILKNPLPLRFLGYRTRIPEGYRCQDLTYHDVLTMAERLLDSCKADFRPILVIGPRTAGGYFAPLVCAYLRKHGRTTEWITIRPKDGLTAKERSRISKSMKTALVAVVDDHPNTGQTFALIDVELRRLGAKSDSIIMVAPEHPAQADWSKRIGSIKAVTLPHAELHNRLLLDDSTVVTSLLRDFYKLLGWQDAKLVHSDPVEAINARLRAGDGVSFQVRLKRLFEVELIGPNQQPRLVHVLAKSVGSGWLGYHAVLAGDRLSGFVPSVIGLRYGLLFSEWVGNLDLDRERPHPAQIAAIVPTYVATRVARLGLGEDPSFDAASSHATGWDVLVYAFRRPYGSIVGRLQTGLIRSRLKHYISPLPTLIDGEMALANWIRQDIHVLKTDFEHHNFGGGELDIVDPAFDLASAIHHLGLGPEEERKLVTEYVQATHDIGVGDRLLLSKLISGMVTMGKSLYRLERSQGPLEEWNTLYNSSRDFLTFQMNRYCASLMPEPAAARWSERLFFMDLDGVFDWASSFGQFPHTTPNGIFALRLLQSHGYSVVPNTARSVRHVRDYCRSYALPGAIAEYGCVFVDAVAGREIRLMDDEAADQLAKCRQLIVKLPGVFTDPGYEWTVRAYRFHRDGTRGLDETEVTSLLEKLNLSRLRCIFKKEDTYILPLEVSKGAAIRAVVRHVGPVQKPTVAIGDSREDQDMLQAVDVAYMPSNSAPELLALSNNRSIRVIGKPRQCGLLAAVRQLISSVDGPQRFDRASQMRNSDHVIDAILRACDQPRYVQLLKALLGRLS